jgi:hypothetical protein
LEKSIQTGRRHADVTASRSHLAKKGRIGETPGVEAVSDLSKRQVKSKVKQSRSTPWMCLGERRYSSYSFTTSALDGGEWSASRPSRALPPVPIVQEAGWAPEPV